MTVDSTDDSNKIKVTGAMHSGCNEGKGRLSEAELRTFDLFVSGRSDSAALTDSDSSDQESYVCPCGKSFKRKAPYQRHMDISHSNPESYPCSICGKTFGKRSILTMHMSIHKTTNENHERFIAMETRSTRSQSKSRTAVILSNSSPISSITSKTDSASTKGVVSSYRTRSKDKTSNIESRLSKKRSTSRESAKSKKCRSTSREKTVTIKTNNDVGNYRTRSTSRVTNRTKDSKVESRLTPHGAHTKECSLLAKKTVENNNVLECAPLEVSDISPSPINTISKQTVGKLNSDDISGTILPLSNNNKNSIDLNASQDSDKENNDFCSKIAVINDPKSVLKTHVKSEADSVVRYDSISALSVLNESSIKVEKTDGNKTKENCSASSQSVPSGTLIGQPTVSLETTTPPNVIAETLVDTTNNTFIETQRPTKAGDNQTIKSNQDRDTPVQISDLQQSQSNISKSTPQSSTIVQGNGKTTTVNNNTIQVTSENRFQTREKKPNTQTIVIVIREAKPLKQQKSADSSTGSQNGDSQKTGQEMAVAGPTQKVLVSSAQSNLNQRQLFLDASQNNKMAITQPHVVSTAQYSAQPKSLPIALQTTVTQQQHADNSTKLYSTSVPTVLAPNTAGVLNRYDVPRTVASVAPSFVNNAPRMVAVHRTNTDIHAAAPLANSTDSSLDSGDTTESDEGGNEDYPPTRKSARLDGKIPGWKKIIEKDAKVSDWIDDTRQRKRKVGRPRVEEYSNDLGDPELNGAAQELLAVAEDVELEAEEIADMSAQLFSRRPRMYRDEHVCDICGKAFSSEKYLQMHSSLHGAATPARNLVAENYKAHDFRETDGFKSSWTCKICNKVFAQNSSFKNHMRTHSDERPFVCDICSIGFKERYHLKKHMLFKHSDELKEKCQFCGKRFKDSTAVRAHERIHSDHRPYHCRRCGKAFKTSECLWHHENRSKTCGALGGPPLPPLPKKGRTATRKPKVEPTAAVLQPMQTMQALQQGNNGTTVVVKNERDNMLDLVQQIIQSESKNGVKVPISVAPQFQQHQQQQQNGLVQGPQLSFSTNSQIRMVATPGTSLSNTLHATLPTTTSIGQPAVSVAQPRPVLQQQQQPEVTQQSHTVKIAQGQQLVFSVPMIKDGNSEAAAQVTKAILDAISNTTGHMKGVNIQKTIQCAVNQVQEVIDVTKSHAPTMMQNAQPMVAIPIMAQSNAAAQVVPVLKTESMPVAVPAQGLNHSGNQSPIFPHHQTIAMSSAAATHGVNKTSHVYVQPTTSEARMNVAVTSANKPYTVSILPPISSVAQALKNKEVEPVKVEPEEDYYSSDSDEGEGDYDNELATATASILTQDGVSVPTTRPVATVQPLRRVDTDRHSSTDSDASLPNSSVEWTREPFLIQPQRNKQSNYTCPKCHKGFAVPSAYQKHLLKHEEVRPFRCTTCDIGFKLKVHLKKHNLYRHSDEYPCECSICGKRFKDSSAVRLHERIHSEDRPFECGCGKSFKTKENLWGHQNRKMCPYASYPPPQRAEDGTVVNRPLAWMPNAVTVLSQAQDHVINTTEAQQLIYSNGYAHNNQQKPADLHIATTTTNAMVATQQPALATTTAIQVSNAVLAQNVAQSTVAGVQNPTILISTPKQEPVEQDLATLEPVQVVATSEGMQTTQLPSFETFSATSQAYALAEQLIKKESMAEQCPTIQSLLRRAPHNVTKLPGIQQLFKQHIKPPPPYPGHLTPPRLADVASPAYSYQSSGSPVPSPQQSVPSSPAKSPSFSRQNSQSPITSNNLNMLLNIDALYSSALNKDPLWRSPHLPSGRKGSELASPSMEYCPVSIGIPKSPRSPRSSSAMSPAPSHCGSESMGQNMLWEEDSERKPVLTQWQNADSETLFMELSTNMLSQI